MAGLQVYQALGGQGVVTAQFPPISSTRSPTTSDTVSPNGSPYNLLQQWINTTSQQVFQYLGSGVWALTASSSGDLVSLTDTANTVVTPTAGNIKLAGTTNQLTVTAGSSVLTFTIPSAFIAPGSIAATTTITAGTGITSTTGNIVATAGAVTAGTTVTAGTGITSTTGNIVATAGAVTAGTTMTAGTGITSTTGNIAATAGAVSAGTTVTGGTGVTATTGNVSATAGAVNAGTSMTATLGDITATNGNLVLTAVGNKLKIAASSSATCSAGTFALGGGATTVVSNSAVTASSLIFLQTQALGTVAVASTLAVTSKSANTSFTVTPSVAADTSTIAYLIIN